MITTTLVLAGDIALFDAEAFRVSLMASVSGATDVAMIVSEGSIIVNTRVVMDSEANALAGAEFLRTATLAQLSSALGVTVEFAFAPTVSTEMLHAPSPPPPSPPPPLPSPPPSPPTIPPPAGDASSTALLLVAITGAVLAIAAGVISFTCVYRLRKRRRALDPPRTVSSRHPGTGAPFSTLRSQAVDAHAAASMQLPLQRPVPSNEPMAHLVWPELVSRTPPMAHSSQQYSQWPARERLETRCEMPERNRMQQSQYLWATTRPQAAAEVAPTSGGRVSWLETTTRHTQALMSAMVWPELAQSERALPEQPAQTSISSEVLAAAPPPSVAVCAPELLASGASSSDSVPVREEWWTDVLNSFSRTISALGQSESLAASAPAAPTLPTSDPVPRASQTLSRSQLHSPAPSLTLDDLIINIGATDGGEALRGDQLTPVQLQLLQHPDSAPNDITGGPPGRADSGGVAKGKGSAKLSVITNDVTQGFGALEERRDMDAILVTAEAFADSSSTFALDNGDPAITVEALAPGGNRANSVDSARPSPREAVVEAPAANPSTLDNKWLEALTARVNAAVLKLFGRDTLLPQSSPSIAQPQPTSETPNAVVQSPKPSDRPLPHVSDPLQLPFPPLSMPPLTPPQMPDLFPALASASRVEDAYPAGRPRCAVTCDIVPATGLVKIRIRPATRSAREALARVRNRDKESVFARDTCSTSLTNAPSAVASVEAASPSSTADAILQHMQSVGGTQQSRTSVVRQTPHASITRHGSRTWALEQAACETEGTLSTHWSYVASQSDDWPDGQPVRIARTAFIVLPNGHVKVRMRATARTPRVSASNWSRYGSISGASTRVRHADEQLSWRDASPAALPLVVDSSASVDEQNYDARGDLCLSNSPAADKTPRNVLLISTSTSQAFATPLSRHSGREQRFVSPWSTGTVAGGSEAGTAVWPIHDGSPDPSHSL